MVTVRIQHHPSRASLLTSLSEALAPLPVEVITDPEPDGQPSPWRCYRHCLTDLPTDGHVLVLQDDVRVCHNFARAVERIAEANQESPIALFIGGPQFQTIRRLRPNVGPYLPIHWHDPLPVVALLWPVHKAREFLRWAEANPRATGGPGRDRSDDAWTGTWMRRTKQQAYATWPSLVEHLGVPSLIRRNRAPDTRRAKWFIGGDDPLAINWERL